MKYLIGIMLIGMLASCGDTTNFKGGIKCDEIDGLERWSKRGDESLSIPSDYTGIIKSCVDGYIQRTEEWKDGKMNGLERYYNVESGVLVHEVSYKNHRKEGLSKEYDANGILIMTVEYKDGFENGSVKKYYQNGQVKSEYIMRDGEGNVEFSKEYYKNGQLKSHCIYEETDENVYGFYVVSYDCWDEDGNQIECERTAEDINNDR